MAYISANDVAAIRKELKARFPNWKFSVRKGGNGLSVDVTILKGTCAFDGKTNSQVNEYWLAKHWKNADDLAALTSISEIMHNAPGRAGGKVFFDNSDIQSDYFHTAFYTHLSIGAWNAPYQCVKD